MPGDLENLGEMKNFVKLAKLNSEIDCCLVNALKLAPDNIYIDMYQLFTSNDERDFCRLVHLKVSR